MLPSYCKCVKDITMSYKEEDIPESVKETLAFCKNVPLGLRVN